MKTILQIAAFLVAALTALSHTNGGTTDMKVEELIADTPPAGWNKNWRHARLLVLAETAGIARVDEPVVVTMTFPAERITDPVREIRVVTKDGLKEIPCQVYDIVKTDPAAQRPAPDGDENGFLYDGLVLGPAVQAQIAFLASVPAGGEQGYYVFYGNPDAQAPDYPTDLALIGTGLSVVVRNEKLSLRLSENGQLNGIDVLAGGAAPVQLRHGAEDAPACMHWNPDVYAHPRRWTHPWRRPPVDWQIVKGPVFIEVRRKAALTGYPELDMSLAYRLYSKQPYFLSRSVMRLEKSISLLAWRNDEMVFNLGTFERALWETADGALREGTLDAKPVNAHGDIYFLPPDVPWLAFHRGSGAGALALASVRLAHAVFTPGQDTPLVRNHTYVTVYKDDKGGGLEYWFRAISYGFDAPGKRAPLVLLPEGTIAFEHNAYLAAWGEPAEVQRGAQQLRQRLANPLAPVRLTPEPTLP